MKNIESIVGNLREEAYKKAKIKLNDFIPLRGLWQYFRRNEETAFKIGLQQAGYSGLLVLYNVAIARGAVALYNHFFD